MFDELADHDRKIEERYIGKVKIGHVSQLFDLTIGIVEEIEELDNDVLDEKG